MNPDVLLEQLLALAQDLGIEMRRLGGAGAPGDPPVRSGACRLRGRVCLWLDPSEPLEDRIEAVVQALRTFAAPQLEDRFIAPQLRARLEAEDPRG